MRRMVLAAGFFLILSSGGASAGVTDFQGIWADPATDGSDISRIVVTPATGDKLDIHIYGKCVPSECHYGGGPARLYADGDGSKDITVIAIDFDTGFSHNRLTLRPAVGHTLRFEELIDFTDGQPSYVAHGALTYSDSWDAAPSVASNAPPTPAAPSAVPAPAPVPSEAAPPPEPPSHDWFGDNGIIGLGPAKPHGYHPAAGEDCTPFDPGQTRVSNTDGNWRLGDFSHRLVNFGPRRADAERALAVLDTYHFDEICYVTRAAPAMLYWKRAGQVPRESTAGEACIAIDPAAVKTEQRDGDWSVVSGFTALLDFGDDGDAAKTAASVIKTYRLNRQCFAGPPGSAMQYWLAQ